MLEFSVVTTGMPVAYIELTHGMSLQIHVFQLIASAVAVTIVTNEVAKVFCALFHDKEDVSSFFLPKCPLTTHLYILHLYSDQGPAFGKLICSEILHAFVEEYGGELGTIGHNLKDFHGFTHKIAETIKNSVKPVLVRCKFSLISPFN